MIRSLLVAIVVCVTAHVARAYPQFQLVKDSTCTACHLSPAGNGLLSENGLNTAGSISQWGTAPEFFYNKVPLPNWLQLGGDVRAAGGLDANGQNHQLAVFPMEFDIYAAATYNNLSLHVTGGFHDPKFQYTPDFQDSYEAKTLVQSTEHWLQWQQNEGAVDGLFVRVGRFMPVYGLRFAEHPFYDRRYGGTPLYGETYAAAVEYIDPKWEVHATGFIKDPLYTDSIERGNGATLYAETRIADKTLVGIEGKLDVTTEDKKYYGGITGKQLVTKDFLIEAELELIHQKIDIGGKDNQFVGTLLGSYFLGAVMVDVGVEVYHSNLSFILNDQEAGDLNVHWFMSSHLELVLTNRLQMLAFGADGRTSGYTLLQAHYRL